MLLMEFPTTIFTGSTCQKNGKLLVDEAK